MNAWIETDVRLSSGDDHRQVTYYSVIFLFINHSSLFSIFYFLL